MRLGEAVRLHEGASSLEEETARGRPARWLGRAAGSQVARSEASVEELVNMIQRGELRLPEMQRRYVWRATRVRDLLDSSYRGYPSGAICLWETDEAVPFQDMRVTQQL